MASATALASVGRVHAADQASSALADSLPPVRQITRGPLNHWFGYYDKLEFDPTNRFVLSGEVAFEHRTPRADDTIRVGMVDTADNDKWIPLGKSSAWGWQQGCMLQWRPQSASEVVWNDRQGDQHVCRVMDVKQKSCGRCHGPFMHSAAMANGRSRPIFHGSSGCVPATGTSD
ncbi:putative secreted protein [Rhodopirellula maiorica SM1]|uniref:Putative secreted protein n=2 Tax=Novipirellula TaxID=2795426 RepID=M5RV19_9BACT|nr:putative secreted protein [Rhodopirellula maiorica SM1]